MSKRLYAITIPDHLTQDVAERIKGEAHRMIKNATGEDDPKVIVLGGGATMAVFEIKDE